MKRLLIIVLLLTGCSPLVCRHEVMSHAAYAEERRLQYQIVVYDLEPMVYRGQYARHAQVKTDRGWMSERFGLLIFSDSPQYVMGNRVDYYNITDYIEFLRGEIQ